MSEIKIIATAAIMATANHADGLAEYGAMGIALAALGWFTVWSEKRRDARDKENRIFMEHQHKELIEALHRSEKRYHELVISLNQKDQ